MFNKRFAIDLGSAFTRIQTTRKGVVINEPSIVAEYLESNETAAVGREALEMVERTPESLHVTEPLVSGVVADFKQTRLLLEHLMNRAIGRFRFSPPTAMLTVASGATSTERRAVYEVAKSAGIKTPHLIDAPVAAAIGAGIPISDPHGNLIVHIGAGTTEVAVISLSGVVAQQSLRLGGHTLDEAISKYVRTTHNITIGSQTAREVKHLIASAMPRDKDETMIVHGRDTIGGMPKQVEVSGNELVQPIEDILEKVVLCIRNVMERTSPELVADIAERGMILTGGTAELARLDKLMRKVVGVPCIISQDPSLAAIKGAHLALTNLSDYEQSLFRKRL